MSSPASHITARYLIAKARLLEITGTDYIFNELTAHAIIARGGNSGSSGDPLILTRRQLEHPALLFPDTFIVTITPEGLDDTDDTNGIRYYANAQTTRPFLIMGESDNGYILALALFRAIGVRLN